MGTGRVDLVGAGPGHPDLISRRGLECIRRAQVLVHDRLVSRSLLAEAAPECEIIYAGKEGHGPWAMSQQAINELLIARARSGRRVCRLKGGDPFVFGRGGEEAEALRRAGIPFSVVPGVTAGLGATAYAGIPVTHRGVSSAVTFLTAHGAADMIATIDWAALVASRATLVLYMGLVRLAEVRDQLVQHGLSPETPAAAIQWGTRAEQQVVAAPLALLPEQVQGLSQPTLVIIGEVVAREGVLAWTREWPLFGRRVLVAGTGAATGDATAREVAAAIADLGGEPWLFPRQPGGPYPHEIALLREELAEGGIHQVAVTSPEAAQLLLTALGAEALRALPCHCQGEAAAVLAQHGMSPLPAAGGLLT